ncbi:phage major tail protein, TP901-1 family [Rummeliibacillus pycnus]|uniref:phage major tail protein, TP901-1 family n=1 Tax=Rummeliibacillus pycnus TaxID=101070 RepID=UPI0037CBC25D
MKNGKDTILLVQPVDVVFGTAALVIANQTESSYSLETDMKDEQTKFGRIVGYGNNSESFEFSAYGERKDEGQMAVINAIRNKKQLKVWEVDVQLSDDNKHDALFAYCIVESIERSNSQDGYEEVSGTLQVYGTAKEGKIDKLPIEVIEFGQYGFEKPGEYQGEADDRKAAPTGLKQ